MRGREREARGAAVARPCSEAVPGCVDHSDVTATVFDSHAWCTGTIASGNRLDQRTGKEQEIVV